ncbi:unnamed protein product [Dicrocoelium dendriticum]|nr:unnamed protein product [Dicrocoelium dendriticum]
MSLATQTSKRKSADEVMDAPPEKVIPKPVLDPSSKKPSIVPIKLSLPGQTKKSDAAKVPSTKLQAVFNSDDETEDEEIPEEARIRMRNKGRFTPTSFGPNSYGKEASASLTVVLY